MYVAHDLLVKFVKGFEEIYGENEMKMSIHLLLHLPGDMYFFGFMPSHWMFLFEGLNGIIKGLVKDTTNGICPRMVNALSSILCLPAMRAAIPQSLPPQIAKLTAAEPLPVGLDGSPLSGAVGKKILLSKKITEGGVRLTHSFKRYLFNGRMIHSISWKKAISSSSCFIQIRNASNKLNYRVERFLTNDANDLFIELTSCRTDSQNQVQVSSTSFLSHISILRYLSSRLAFFYRGHVFS